jgi:hypothetical protein
VTWPMAEMYVKMCPLCSMRTKQTREKWHRSEERSDSATAAPTRLAIALTSSRRGFWIYSLVRYGLGLTSPLQTLWNVSWFFSSQIGNVILSNLFCQWIAFVSRRYQPAQITKLLFNRSLRELFNFYFISKLAKARS